MRNDEAMKQILATTLMAVCAVASVSCNRTGANPSESFQSLHDLEERLLRQGFVATDDEWVFRYKADDYFVEAMYLEG